ncbi:MAG: ATP-binding cassette domain-containing protein [Tenericutes bacterium]|nr:ATP-binding cassette domain-containing protein [Mycoplasmatota bacterium]
MIEIKNVSKSYKINKIEQDVLTDVNLLIEENEILGIVGLSGAGKSTLIRMMNGLVKPSKGQVFVNGRAIHNLRQKDLNRMRYAIGMVFQHFNLLSSMTVEDNIKLALKIANYKKEEIKDRIHEVIDLVGLNDKLKAYPKDLSGGQRQRVAIARALANKPSILLCDEATSSLDQVTASEIVKLLRKIQSKTNITIVFITHQIEVAKDLCKRIIVMDSGKIIEDSSTKDLFVRPVHPKTKQLIKSIVYDVSLPQRDVYELIYSEKNNNETIISDTVKHFDIDLNIIQAKSISIQEEYIGYLYVQLFGKQIDNAITFLKSKGIEVNRHG